MKRVTGLRPRFPQGSFVSGDYVDLGLLRLYRFNTAITTGVTAVPTGATDGVDLAMTTHATGKGSLFINIGGVWTKTA